MSSVPSPDVIAVLRCPTCRAPLQLEASSMPRYGVLSCGSHEFPVVDGVPVLKAGRVDVLDHTSGRVEAEGPTEAELVGMIRGADPLDALVALLTMPPNLSGRLRRVRGADRLLTRGPVGRERTRRHRDALRQRLRRPVAEASAEEWMRFFYVDSRGGDPDLLHYFLHRFAMPRHLGSMALSGVLPTSGRILDLACGLGHVMHHWTRDDAPIEAIGVDRNFFQLWVAQHWVAPRATYVCADADRPLPFATDAFDAAMCSDAFHLLPDPAAVLGELGRCVSTGPIVLDRVGNGLEEPLDVPDERSPQEYSALVGTTPHRVVGEAELIQAYQQGRGLALADDRDLDELTSQKWLSIVISPDGTALRDHPDPAARTHTVPPLRLNPIYSLQRSTDGWRLGFGFPSTWFAFENWAMLGYHAAGIRLREGELADILAQPTSARAVELADRFVLLNLPERYLSGVADAT